MSGSGGTLLWGFSPVPLRAGPYGSAAREALEHLRDRLIDGLGHHIGVRQRPRHVEFNQDGSLLWASSEIGGTVAVVDVASRQIIHKLNFEIRGVHRDKIQPVGIKLSSDGRYAFVALGPANHIAVVDAKTYEVLDYLLVGRRVWHLEFNSDESRLLSANGVSGDVSVIDVNTLKVIKSIKVGRYPWGLAVKS